MAEISNKAPTSFSDFTVSDFINKRNSQDVNYQVDQEYIAIPGTIVRTIFEFPQYSKGDKSAIIVLDDIMTLSYSVFRVKSPVVTLGQNSVTGYGLGVKTVAGSVIRSVFTTDNLTEFQSKCYLEDMENIASRLTLNVDSSVPTGAPLKDQFAFMKDDLASFNIHLVTVTETPRADDPTRPYMRFESIIGAMIINNGQVFSVEDLITESTFSFQAKAVRSTTNIEDFSRGYSTNPFVPSVTSIMNKRK